MTAPEVNDSAPLPPTRPAPPRARRALWHALLRSVWAAVLGLPVVAVGLLIALLHTSLGTQLALALVPGLKVMGAQGALLGEHFGAARLEVRWASGQGVVEVHHFRWEGAQWRWWLGDGVWAGVHAKSLQAQEVVVRTPASTGQDKPLPASLKLPISVWVDQVQAKRVVVNALPAWQDISAQVRLGDDGGAYHRIPQAVATWGHARYQAQASVQTQRPFALTAQAQAQSGAPPMAAPAASPAASSATASVSPAWWDAPWEGQAQASGTVADFSVTAQLHATQQRHSPQLDAVVQVLPLSAWPLGRVSLTTRQLDVRALWPAAPQTQLSGRLQILRAGLDLPFEAVVQLTNEKPGRWDQGQLPLRSLILDAKASGSPTRELTLPNFDVSLFDGKAAAGRWRGKGTWSDHTLVLTSRLSEVRPQSLDKRAPAMVVSGPLDLRWQTQSSVASGSTPWALHWRGDLEGRLDGAPYPVQLQWEGQASPQSLEVLQLRAVAGPASADVKLQLRQLPNSLWRAQSSGRLAGFDPAAWFAGEPGSAWRRGPHRLHAQWTIDLLAPKLSNTRSVPQWLQSLQGDARMQIDPSELAGVPLQGQIRLERDAPSNSGQVASLSSRSRLQGTLQVGRNTVEFSGSGDPMESGDNDKLNLRVAAQALADLAPWARLHPSWSGWIPRQGTAQAQLSLSGRWPKIQTQGQVGLRDVRMGGLALRDATAQWSMATGAEEPVTLQAEVSDLRLPGQQAAFLRAEVLGTARQHRIALDLATAWRPAAAVERTLGLPAGSGTQAQLVGQGAWEPSSSVSVWRGQVDRLSAGVWDGRGFTRGVSESSWLDARDLRAQLQWNAQAELTAIQASAGRAVLAGGLPLRWEAFEYRSPTSAQGRADFNIQAQVEPTAIAPFLQRALGSTSGSPSGAWSGDLRVSAQVGVRAAQTFEAQVRVRRESGDLQWSENGAPQAMGLTAAEVSLSAKDGQWRFAPRLSGRALGNVGGVLSLRTDPALRWPDDQAPLEGTLDLSVPNLGVWTPWIPPGWRLAGSLQTDARVGGRLGSPQLTGSLQAQGVSVRNLLLGVALTEGQARIALDGETARVEQLSMRAGEGRVTVEGSADLGAQPQAQLKIKAQNFRVLGRVDRQLVLSGDAHLALGRESVRVQGQAHVDSGLFDLSSRDAPTLDDDVKVRRNGQIVTDDATTLSAPTRWSRWTQMDLDVDLGEQLRLRGRGLDTALQGRLRASTPNGVLVLHGEVRAAKGTYAAYGQKMEIERGVVTFQGAPETARLDILALRPNIDSRVGVAISGPTLNPRVRLYSEPAMSETDKLSWLVLGRGADGLGRADTAVLQRAAVALLAGEGGEGPNDNLMRAIGLDSVSLRQSEGDVRETVISLGKQLSQRWYVGYERGVNATNGTWQLIYRIAQRFTLRAQSGLENSLDLIWTWRFEKP